MYDVFLTILLTSFVATALSAMSGGGASVINIPVMLSLGIPFPLATSAQKVSSMFWVLPASYNYLKDRKINWPFLLWFSGIGLVGVYLGVLVVLAVNQRLVEIIIGILILCLVGYVLLKKDVGLNEEKARSPLKRFLAYPFAIALGFYESFFGSGNGILFSIVAFKTRGFDFIDALGYYFSVAFLWEVFAVILFFKMGYFDLNIMIPTVIGSVIGGYVGSRYAKYKGNKFIKLMFVAIGTVLGIKLLVGI
jgi:uncharacterized membrane protein YfcA